MFIAANSSIAWWWDSTESTNPFQPIFLPFVRLKVKVLGANTAKSRYSKVLCSSLGPKGEPFKLYFWASSFQASWFSGRWAHWTNVNLNRRVVGEPKLYHVSRNTLKRKKIGTLGEAYGAMSFHGVWWCHPQDMWTPFHATSLLGSTISHM